MHTTTPPTHNIPFHATYVFDDVDIYWAHEIKYEILKDRPTPYGKISQQSYPRLKALNLDLIHLHMRQPESGTACRMNFGKPRTMATSAG